MKIAFEQRGSRVKPVVTGAGLNRSQIKQVTRIVQRRLDRQSSGGNRSIATDNPRS